MQALQEKERLYFKGFAILASMYWQELGEYLGDWIPGMLDQGDQNAWLDKGIFIELGVFF